jgi:putative transcriptional regulator
MKRQWLVAIRNQQDLTQQQVADAAGISRSYYSGIEIGARDVKPDTAQAIAGALGFEWTLFYPQGRKTSHNHQKKVSA